MTKPRVKRTFPHTFKKEAHQNGLALKDLIWFQSSTYWWMWIWCCSGQGPKLARPIAKCKYNWTNMYCFWPKLNQFMHSLEFKLMTSTVWATIMEIKTEIWT